MDSFKDESTVTMIFKARDTLLTVLERRGFAVDEYKDFSMAHLEQLYKNDQLGMLLVNDRKVFVHFCLKKKPDFLNIVTKFFNATPQILTPADDLIIVSGKQSDSADDHVAQTWQEGYFVTIIDIAHLQFNILDHDSVPPHTVLSEAEKRDVLNKYHCIESKMPKIDRKDPVAKLMGMRPGQMCRIDRPSPTGLIEQYYRVCI